MEQGNEIRVRESIGDLSLIARQLRLLGPVILGMTLVNVGLFLWGVGRWTHSGGHVGSDGSIVLVNLALSIATVGMLGLFETLRKRGDAIFQEVSDELQWYVGRRDPRGRRPRQRPILDARVTLRTFAAAAELPLVPGRYGGAAYALLNLLTAVASVFLLNR